MLNAPATIAADCDGCVPLTDLGAELYLDQFQGGLYPGGANQPPQPHAQLALNAAQQIRPRNAAGQIDPAKGLIGFISIGMSNANQEFSVLERTLDSLVDRNASVVVVNTAQGGVPAERAADPDDPYWIEVAQRLESAGLTNAQVQVAWIQQDFSQPPVNTFPERAIALKETLAQIARHLRKTFPNLRILYCSSRIYAGYTDNPFRTEPLAYESAFAFKWLIEDQINNDPSLNANPALGPVQAPVLLWGAYLWANGEIPRSDGLTWLVSDYEADMIHPNADGEAKSASLQLDFLQNDPTAQAWLAPRFTHRLITLSPTDDAFVDSSAPNTNFGNETLLFAAAQQGTQRASFLRFALPDDAFGQLVHAKLLFQTVGGNAPTHIFGVGNDSWDEGSITWNNRPGTGPLIATPGPFFASASMQAAVNGIWSAASNGIVSFAVFPANPAGPANRVLASSESSTPPMLVLSLRVPFACLADLDNSLIVDTNDLGILLGAFGNSSAGDINGDGVTDTNDLGILLGAFGSTCN